MSLMSKALSMVGLQRKADVVALIDITGQGRPGVAGEHVSAMSTLGLSSVWACANLLSGTISSLPCEVFKGGEGVPKPAPTHPLARVLHDSPNYDQTSLDFWEFICLSIELWGNAYARIERSGGRIVALWPVRPDLMHVRRLSSGGIEYTWSQDGRGYRLQDRDVFHIRGPGGDPLGGMSTLTFARNALSSALAADRTAASLFRNGLRPSAVIKFKEWLTPEQRAQSDVQMVEYAGATNAGRPIRMEGGMEYQQLGMLPEDAQMLETRQFSVEEVCRFFGVPPVMIGHAGGSTAWPTSVEQQVLVFQKFTLRRRLKRIEQAVRQQLMTAEDRGQGLFVKFNLEGLLRGDSAARSAFYGAMTQMGAMSINEVRALENLPPVAGGEVPRMQMQNVPITQAGKDT